MHPRNGLSAVTGYLMQWLTNRSIVRAGLAVAAASWVAGCASSGDFGPFDECRKTSSFIVLYCDCLVVNS